MKNLSFLLLFVGITYSLCAQVNLSGTVTSGDKVLHGANLAFSNTYLGTFTDANGKFLFKNIQPGTYTLITSYIGYKPDTIKVDLSDNKVLAITLTPEAVISDEVIVISTRPNINTPTTSSLLKKATIQERNMGQDLPYLLNNIPGVISSSDAGAGIGYTGLRVRGTDITGINVTVNGIPLNDAESQGVFWVNMPDFSTSLNSIQVQRGIGTSTNGAAAFGATINLETIQKSTSAFIETDNSLGSFNTIKSNLTFGTGLINKSFSLEGRLSRISSDGFIDRAKSDLQSYYVQAGYYTQNTLLKAVHFSGKEKTYQAWWGVPKARLENNQKGMQRYADHYLFTPSQTEHMINSDSRTYNYYTYENETDNYKQDHYQLHFSHKFNRVLINAALHYTHGEGYYEQFRNDDAFSDYGLENVILNSDTIRATDLARQKWLDNDFYGATWSAAYNSAALRIDVGGAANQYKGDHFGEIIWAEYSPNAAKDYQWYFNRGFKTDISNYAKAHYSFQKLHFFADIQYRFVAYSINGFHDDFSDLTNQKKYNFINPKAGIKLNVSPQSNLYASVARVSREPSRSDFRDAPEGQFPTAEKLNDYELGFSFSEEHVRMNVNSYFMHYKNQLVLTGKINDVGSAIKTNVDNSYRLGIELDAAIHLLGILEISPALALSKNKIIGFVEYVDDWDNGGQIATELGTTDISFSPGVVASNSLSIELMEGLQASLQSKYVGKQYIDNASNDNNVLDAYFVNDIFVQYHLSKVRLANITLKLQVNNIFNEAYETNAWVYNYVYGQERYSMDGYFPQAGTNFLAGVNIRF